MVGVEQAFELDLTQKDAVVSLTGRGAGGVEVAAPQGVIGIGIAEPVGVAEPAVISIASRAATSPRAARSESRRIMPPL